MLYGAGARLRVAGEEGDLQVHIHPLRYFLKNAYRWVANSSFYATDFCLGYTAALGQLLLREILTLPGLDHSAHEGGFRLKLVTGLREFRVKTFLLLDEFSKLHCCTS